MARKVGQIIARGGRRWLIRVYLGRDHETNKRNYHNRTIHGPMRPPKVVSEQLGHASMAFTLDTYAHVLPHMQDEAAARIEAMLLGQRL